MIDPRSIKARRNEAFIAALAERVAPFLFRYFAGEVRDVEHVPAGPALLVGNHSGGMSTPDTFLLGAAIYRERGAAHVPFGLAHDFPLRVPGVADVVRALGGVPACHEAAAELFAADRKVLVYPGGDVDSLRPTRLRHRVLFGGRTGYARVAIRHQVPIVPVVAAGGQSTFWVGPDLLDLVRGLGFTDRMRVKTWPVTFSIPWGLFPGPTPPFIPLPARILVQVLPPIAPPAADANDTAAVEALDEQVRRAMEKALGELEDERERRGKWATSEWYRKE